MDGKIGNVSKDSFLGADQTTRDGLLFDTLETIYDHGELHHTRICTLENRRKMDTGVAAGTGILGGFLAMLTKEIWKW